MALLSSSASVPLPAEWPKNARLALLHVVSMAHLALTRSRSWCADSRIARVRLGSEVDRLREEVALLREELRIKDARLALIPAAERPRYPPELRMAILALRSARRWSARRTARAFLLTAPTIASWMRRLDEEGPDALVRLPSPVSCFPNFVAVVVQQLRAVCPLLGKVRIAQMLARAGLVLSASTVKRMLERSAPRPRPPGDPEPQAGQDARAVPRSAGRVVFARYPAHVWHIDLTAVPTALGFWVPWLPFALAQRWPFGAWIAVVLDHFTRSVVARGVFTKEPTAAEMLSVLDCAVAKSGRAPRYTVTDQGSQFQKEYRAWCATQGVRPRFGAVGKTGSIAVIERFFLSMKNECFRRIVLPLSVSLVERELDRYLLWYHEHRPHRALGGATPSEVLAGAVPRERPPPQRGPRGSLPPVRLAVSHPDGRAHLPVIELRRVA
jgi:transposase InsO family protein